MKEQETPTEGAPPAPEAKANEQEPKITFFDDDGNPEEPDVETPPAGETPPGEDPPEDPPADPPEGTPPVSDNETPPEGEEGEDGEKKLSPVEKKINKLTFEKHEERRKREAAENRILELEGKIKASEAESEEIQVPPMPDPTDQDYDAKLAAREVALKKLGEIEARKKLEKEEKQRAIQEAIDAQSREIQTHVDTMFASGETLGITKESLVESDKKVAQFVTDAGVAKYILAHESSPLLITYLASAAETLAQLGKMDPIRATEFLLTKVIPEAEKLRPDVTNTPDPPEIPEGRGASPAKDPFLEGVTME